MTDHVDYRSRVAAEKRARTLRRLLESALLVFSQKGLDATSIEDIIAAAGVARGTFYNYFQTNEELMAALLEKLSRELLVMGEIATLEAKDPAERLSNAIRMILHTVRNFPILGRFMSKVGVDPRVMSSLSALYLPRDIQECIEAGYISLADPILGVELVSGIFFSATYAISMRPGLASDYPEQVITHMFMGLGFSRENAERLTKTPLQLIEFPPTSLLAEMGRKFSVLP